MTGVAILIFLGETLLGTLMFVAIAGVVKLMAERAEAPETAPAPKEIAVPSRTVGAKT